MHDLATIKRMNDEHSKKYFDKQRKDEIKLLNALTKRIDEDKDTIAKLKEKLGL